MSASRPRTMFSLLIVAIMVSCTPSFAAESDEPAPQSKSVAFESDDPIRRLVAAAFDEKAQPQFPQGRVVHHCCNAKGAIIGAAIGAAAGWWVTWSLCEGSCPGKYIESMAVLGGIGALVGAYADRHNAIPIAPPDRRFRVRALVTPRTRKALATVAF